MKPRFRLAAVLRVRRHEQDRASAALAVSERAYREALAAIDRAQERVADARRFHVDQLCLSLGAPALRAAASGVAWLESQVEGAREREEGARRQVAEHRSELLAARQRVRALEQLERVHARRVRAEQDRREQRVLDEAGAHGFRRRARALACAWLWLGPLLLGTPLRAEEPATAEDYGVTPLLTEIRARQAALDDRERSLDDRERSIEALEAAATESLAELERIARTVEERIEAWEADNGDSVRKLAKIYSAMAPGRAAQLLEELEVGLATQIVAKMKDKKSAAVLAQLSEDRALDMSRRVAHPLAMEPASPSAN